MMNPQQQQQQGESASSSDRVGARPRHAYVESDVVSGTVERVAGTDSAATDNHQGLVGILAREQHQHGHHGDVDENDSMDNDEHRPLSPQNAILASEQHNVVLGTILQKDEEALLQQQQQQHTTARRTIGGTSVITTTEPSTDTEPSSFLLKKNTVNVKLSQQDDEEDRFSDDERTRLDHNKATREGTVEPNQNDGNDPDRQREQEQDLTLSPYDYDTNWDMIGHCTNEAGEDEAETDEVDLLNKSGASLLAEAAAATATLAATASVSIESPPEKVLQQGATLQGIAPQQNPSCEYNYNVHWDMIGRDEQENRGEQSTGMQADNFEEEHRSGVANNNHNTGRVSSLAEAAAATAMLKGNAADMMETTHEHPLQQQTNDVDEEPLQQPVPMDGRTRSTPTPRMYSKTARPRRGVQHDPHYLYNYRPYHTRQEESLSSDVVHSRSSDNLDSLNAVADEHSRRDEETSSTAAVAAMEEIVLGNGHVERAPSEMNESIATSTTSSSSGGGGSARRRRLRSQRPHGLSWSSAYSSSSSIRSRTGSSASQRGALDISTLENSNNNNTSGRRLRASLDSGMAAVRRWIRSRGSAQQQSQQQRQQTPSFHNPRSSRAARRWQSEHSDTLQLGEEDLIALANAGHDPRGMIHHHDDSSVTFIHQPSSMYLRSAMELPAVEEEDEPRQRSLSEPDGNRLRDFFFERAATGLSARNSSGFLRRRTAATAITETIQHTTESTSSGMSATSAHLQSAALSSSLFHSPRHGASWSVEMTEQQRQQSGDGTSAAVAPLDGNNSNAGTTTISGGVNAAADGEERGEGPNAPSETLSDNNNDNADQEQADPDPNREARTRWIRINRRFQLIITMVALVFSLLLFAILVCWVVLTSAYVVSIDKDCDVPLKMYYWLATLQLILDVFRTDIMRVVFRWDTNSNERIPARVIVYNIAYLTYAMLVLRMGIRSVFIADDVTCQDTAPELFQSSTVFVVLSISAWSIIVLGYLVPFCFVAMLLTWNGYTPTADRDGDPGSGAAGVAAMGAFGGVFPAAYSNSGAPPGCIDQLRVVMLEEFPDDYPHECCICMGEFCAGEVIVATACEHVFHKRCCQEWLRQARTCPVCRMDIPSSIGGGTSDGAQPDEPRPVSPPDDTSATAAARRRLGPPFASPTGHGFGREEFHQEVVNLFRILRQHEERLRQRNASNNNTEEEGGAVGTNNNTDEEIGSAVGREDASDTALSSPTTIGENQLQSGVSNDAARTSPEPIDMEEGRFSG